MVGETLEPEQKRKKQTKQLETKSWSNYTTTISLLSLSLLSGLDCVCGVLSSQETIFCLFVKFLV
jgi:hypothetical protein